MKTRILFKRPPHWRIIKFFFPQYDPESTIAVAFGRVIYTGAKIPPDYVAHEEQHLRQHCHSYVVASLWWIAYCLSKSFRYSQERDAFRAQYKWILKHEPWKRTRKLIELADQLASPLYGSMVTAREAQKEILSYE